MVWSVFINGLMGFVWVITLLYVSPNLNALLSNPTGVAIIEIISPVFNLRGTIFVEVLLMYIAVVATIGLTASVSRTVWAFARDNGFPFQRHLIYVDPNSKVPTTAIAVVTIIEMMIGVIYFGNTTAFQAVLSVATIAILFTYFVPPALMLFYARKNIPLQYGPFKLGKFGVFLNMVSSGFTFLFLVLLNFPTVYINLEQADSSPILLLLKI
jgi:choline transport protein